jgi:hypothetical protein
MAYETVESLIKAFREDEKDNVAPYFWSDNQLVRWMNEGLTEFAEETQSFYDDQSDVTLIPYSIGQTRFELDPCIIDVRDAWVDGHPHCRLERYGWAFTDAWRGGYGLAYNGCSSHFYFDGVGQLHLRPKPSAAGAVRLRVIRRPVRDLDKCDKIPDMLPSDRRHLLLYLAYKAYNVADGETFDKSKSNNRYAEFLTKCQDARESAILRRGDCSRPIRSNW